MNDHHVSTRPAKQRSRMRFWQIIALLCAVVLVVGGIVLTRRSRDAATQEQRKREATQMCLAAVEQQARSSLSYELSPMLESSLLTLGSGQHRVAGYFDARVDDGRSLRHDWVCLVTHTGTAWQIDNISIVPWPEPVLWASGLLLEPGK